MDVPRHVFKLLEHLGHLRLHRLDRIVALFQLLVDLARDEVRELLLVRIAASRIVYSP